MCANQDIDTALIQALEYFLPFLCLDFASHQSEFYTNGTGHLGHLIVVLLSQYEGGSHNDGLIAILPGKEGGNKGNRSLTAANITGNHSVQGRFPIRP